MTLYDIVSKFTGIQCSGKILSLFICTVFLLSHSIEKDVFKGLDTKFQLRIHLKMAMYYFFINVNKHVQITIDKRRILKSIYQKIDLKWFTWVF